MWSAADAYIDTAAAALRQIRDSHPAGALRNAVLSLVVLAGDAACDARIAHAVGDALGVGLPSRVIVVSTPPGRTWDTKTSLTVSLCDRAEAPPLCVEQVQLYASGEAVAHLDEIVAPWVLPGLPLAVWVPARVPGPDEPVVAGADRVIVDSGRLGRAFDDDDLAALRSWPAVDLAWLRLRPWRRLLTHALSGEASFVAGVERIDITGSPASSALIAGWLGSWLELSPPAVRLVDGAPPAVRVRTTRDGRRADLAAEVVDDRRRVRVTTTFAGGSTHQHLVRLPDDSLVTDVGAALTAGSGHDDTWERAASTATRVLAQQ